MELVVERSDPLGEHDVLRDLGERGLVVQPEGAGEMRHDLVRRRQARVRPEHRDETCGGERAHDFVVVVLDRTGRRPRLEASLLPENRRVELLERRARLDSEPFDECSPRLLVRLERFGLPPRTVERQHQLAP